MRVMFSVCNSNPITVDNRASQSCVQDFSKRGFEA